jgi:hypothetical protein
MNSQVLAKHILEQARVVAVLGAHPDASRPAHYVPAYLAAMGYTVLPVNPTCAGQMLFDHAVVAELPEIDQPVDVVDVFRRSELLPGHLQEILAMRPLPRWVWLQSGVYHDEVTRELEAHGIAVVQDRCMLADHRAFGLPPRS